MAKSKVTSGMWRIDPQKLSRVVDRVGLPVASVEAEAEANANASLIAAAPDMFELLESLEINPSVPEEVIDEVNRAASRPRRLRSSHVLPHLEANLPRPHARLGEVHGRALER
jgi:hypothetical protein